MQFPEPVQSTELIARYLLESSKFSISGMRVKHNAFMPANDNILSVFRIAELTHQQIIEIGEIHVAAPQNRGVIAYAEVIASTFTDQGLLTIPTTEPHPRHVDIAGWTDKEANRSRAQIIAEHARLTLK